MFLILIIAYLLIEIALFIWIGGQIGIGLTILWVIAGFFIGSVLIRRGGQRSREWLQNASRGEVGEGVGEQIFYFISGLLMILPGFFTDIMAVLLLIPPIRQVLLSVFGVMPQNPFSEQFNFVVKTAKTQNDSKSEVIEGEVLDDER